MILPSGTVLLDEHFGTSVVNETEFTNAQVLEAIERQDRQLYSTFQGWANALNGDTSLTAFANNPQNRAGNLWHRDRYMAPSNAYDQMRLAQNAVEEDDVVGGVAETTESLAFSMISFYAEDLAEQDVYNQLAARVNLDGVLRQIWRELYTVSQVYIATQWSRQTFKVRGRTQEGNRRRKEYSLYAPDAITLLDPLKVVPVGSPYGTAFGGTEMLAYIATNEETGAFREIVEERGTRDTIVENLITGRYNPTRDEAGDLSALGVPGGDLWLLDPQKVFRHTLTRPGYRRLSAVRMSNVFDLLDMKRQLRQMERAHLVGGPLRVDQRLATPTGWKPIGAAEVGDEVFSVDGKPTRIIGVYPQGVLPMYRVTFTDGAQVLCDGTHPWTVSRRNGMTRTIPLSQIVDEGLFDDNGPTKRTHRHRIPVAKPLQLPDAWLPLDPYLLGYLLAGGRMKGSVAKIASNNEIVDGLQRCGLWNVGGKARYIPDEYLWASEGQRWALLQGFCDAIGRSNEHGGIKMTISSRKLADGVVQLVQSLGGVGRRTREKSDRTGFRTVHRLALRLNQTESPFRLPYKANTWYPRKAPFVRAIESVEQVSDAEAVCIKTERDDGLFLTEGMVVTHNTNFIVVITKGTDAHPAKGSEIAHLQAESQTVSRVPILVGDHRLNVEIVTPKLDNTLRAERWNTIDSRLTARLYGFYMLGNYAAGASSDDSVKLTKVVARGMESRRHMIRRSLERHLFQPLFNGNDDLETPPKLQFHPRSIALDFDPAYASFLFDLRQAREISRETTLNQFDLSQELEARFREREEEAYDDIFQTQVPFSTPAVPNEKESRTDNGGGRRNGGGAAPGSGQGEAPRRRQSRSSPPAE